MTLSNDLVGMLH